MQSEISRITYKNLLVVAVMTCIFSISMSSCAKKVGCGMEEKLEVETDRHGNLSTKSGSSNLFSPKMRKRSGR